MPDFRPPERKSRGLLIALILAVVAIAAVVAWKMRTPPAEPAPVAAPSAPAEAPASVPAQAPSYPPPAPVAASEAITAEGVQGALESLFGRPALALFRLDDFAHRLTATVDNLAREHASPALWPMAPAPGRFLVQGSGAAPTISPENARRYEPYIGLIERVDLRQVVGVYRRMYPLLQPAYEALGFPGHQFHDRLVNVIDHLVAAPEPAGPLEVRLPNFSPASAPARPWVLYEFTDPSLDALSAGQKLMVRMGVANERRLKARLRELRALLVEPA
jgi:hypothetical protein